MQRACVRAIQFNSIQQFNMVTYFMRSIYQGINQYTVRQKGPAKGAQHDAISCGDRGLSSCR
jgi:hypothetical protein